jgi:DNA repair exonuclease SbcCD ATPase subunit
MILFKNVTYQNFLAVGSAPISIDLSRHHTTLITATNGAGKTTILDAVCFGLYGKAYRNINKPALINSINQKKTLVTITFDIGKKKYKVVRGMKPNVFEIWCNDKMINQDPNNRDYQKILETQILKMNYRAFTQVVVMGSSSYVPFMKLRPHERREFIEDLLDIKVFSVMSKLLALKIKESKERYREIELEIKSTKEMIELQEAFVKSRKEERSNTLAKITKDIQAAQKEITKEKVEIKKIEEQLQKHQEHLNSFADLNEQLSDLRIKNKNIQSTIDEHDSQKNFYESIEECPTCKQSIGDDHRSHIISSIENVVSSHSQELADIQEKLRKLQVKMKDYNDTLEKITNLQSKISTHNQNIHGNNLVVQKYEKEYASLENDTTNIDDDKKKLRAMARKVIVLDEQRRNNIDEQQYQSIASLLLQDSGIKAKIIKQYIPIINKQINKYLNALDFFCNFNLDENFNEIVKSRYRDEFTYDSFSEGEKMRIDLALVFAWRDVARMKNSVNTNLVIMDELLDSSLDQVGMELCINLLYGLKDTNVFVISHRESIADKFISTIKFVKKNNFTTFDV